MIEFLPEDVNQQLSQLDLRVQSARSVPEIPEALNQTVLWGGKRLRPTLCFLMGKILGIPTHKMVPFARAAEFTHSASLAHDDVLDNATVRRERKTLNASTSNARAVLAGDMLLARVMVELSEAGDVDIIHDLALVVEDLVNGEWLQLEARGNLDVTWDHLLEVSRRKTASLMSWCCIVAARLAEKNNRELYDACKNFGQHLGIAFQMVDDVIDYEDEGGKEFSKDLKEGLVNFVVSVLLKNNSSLRNSIQIQNQSILFPWTEAQLQLAKDYVREHAAAHLDKATENFEIIKKHQKSNEPGVEKAISALETLIEYLRVRKS